MSYPKKPVFSKGGDSGSTINDKKEQMRKFIHSKIKTTFKKEAAQMGLEFDNIVHSYVNDFVNNEELNNANLKKLEKKIKALVGTNSSAQSEAGDSIAGSHISQHSLRSGASQSSKAITDLRSGKGTLQKTGESLMMKDERELLYELEMQKRKKIQ
jgi:hypothetical protein